MLHSVGNRTPWRELHGEKSREKRGSRVEVKHSVVAVEEDVGGVVVVFEVDVEEVAEGEPLYQDHQTRLGHNKHGRGRRQVKGAEQITIGVIRELGKWQEAAFLAERRVMATSSA